MKALLLGISFIGMSLLGSDSSNIESRVYSFANAKVEKTSIGEVRNFMDNSTTHCENYEIHSTTIEPGKTIEDYGHFMDFERIIIVKDGSAKFSVNGESEQLNPGSVALLMPNDGYRIENTGSSKATFYFIRYKMKKPADENRGKTAGGSKLLSWDKIQFTPHDKGGIRRYFDRKSAMSERIEMHVTTLNPQIKSHEPHTHVPAEIVVMMDGKTEMEIGSKIYPGTVGDIYFLGSAIPHAIRNTGDKPCMYLAFQWE